MRPKTITRTLAAADDNGICASQTPGGAGDLDIDGLLATAGVADLGAQRHVIITSDDDDTGRVFTVYGTNDFNQEIQEAIAGPNVGAAESVLNFKTVTRVAVDGATAGAIIVGTNGIGESKPMILDNYQHPFQVGLGLGFDGTADATAQYTRHPILGDEDFKNDLTVAWFDHATVDGSTAVAGSITEPVTAVRLKTNSGTGTAFLDVTQGD